MTNKEFDKWLRESLSSVQPELNPQDWDDFVHQVEESESQLDSDFDEAIRNAVVGVGIGSGPDWSRMEDQLDADESQFDQHVKDTIADFKVPYNPTTWPTLDAKLSEDDRLRRRLVYVKVLEIAAVLIVFMTFYNFFPALKSSVIEPAGDMIRKELSQDASTTSSSVNPLSVPGSENSHRTESTSGSSNDVFGASETIQNLTLQKNSSGIPQSLVISSDATSGQIDDSEFADPSMTAAANAPSSSVISTFNLETLPHVVENFNSTLSTAELLAGRPFENIRALTPGVLSNVEESFVVTPLASAILPILKQKSRVRFGMMAAADVNTLFFPEEHFYSQGRSIRFSEKEIVAGGYSAGASLLFDFNNFIIETGLTYSSKNFGPDRKLFIGSTADRHSLDFENITLNVISLPVYLHWKIDNKGAWRIYATAGAAMHVIANAHYDLLAENIYTSSAAAQSPQQLQQNETEVQRVREHMLDGAKFNSKGYLTAAGGFGVERFFNSRMSLFVQPMYHYQIPFFDLIDQNGKHLQNGSVLLGTRVSL